MRAIVPTWKANPFLSEFFEDFDSLFETRPSQTSFRLACDVEETDDHILLSFDIPGLDEKDIQIEYADATLTISGERYFEDKQESKKRVYSERRFGKFSRTFKLPPTVDSDKIDADYTNGVLHVLLPKKELVKPKKIDVSVNKPGLLDRVFGKVAD